jgi:hypothetical protein
VLEVHYHTRTVAEVVVAVAAVAVAAVLAITE